MSAYADTSFLISLYTPDAHSPAATERMENQPLPLFWTRLHTAEFRNGIRLRQFRNELEMSEVGQVFVTQESDCADGVYTKLEPAWPEVWEGFEKLSSEYTAAIGARSLDVLHVAQAIALKTKSFLTFDSRQAELAKAAGLSVPKLI